MSETETVPAQAMHRPTEKVDMFRYLRHGLSISAPDALRRAMEAYWLLIADFHGFVEDFEGIDGRESYLYGLKLRMIERLFEADQIASGREPLDRLHHLALGLELGASSIVGLSGSDIAELLAGPGSLDDQVTEMQVFGRTLTRKLLGGALGPFDAQGERFILRLLQRWSVIGQRRQQDIQFLVDLLKVP